MSCNHGEQFKDKDRAFIEACLRSTDVPYGELVIIKRFTGFASAGDSARGIQPVPSYTKVTSKAIVDNITPQDILYGGGLYQTGDITISLRENLNYIDTINQSGGQSHGDRIIYEGHEYRIVGKKDTHTLIGREKLVTYVMRKIGNAIG